MSYTGKQWSSFYSHMRLLGMHKLEIESVFSGCIFVNKIDLLFNPKIIFPPSLNVWLMEFFFFPGQDVLWIGIWHWLGTMVSRKGDKHGLLIDSICALEQQWRLEFQFPHPPSRGMGSAVCVTFMFLSSASCSRCLRWGQVCDKNTLVEEKKR